MARRSTSTSSTELEVGFVTKPHGIKGEVIVRLITDRPERLEPGSVLSSDRGPMTVIASRPHQRDFIVVFEGIPDRNTAETYRGVVLRAEPLDDPDVLWVHELVGARVVETDGTDRGVVMAVEANPASDLLVLDSGALVPLRFVVSREEGRVVVDVPPGLFD
jgi:16S rRNA processing protein RimM